MQIAFDSAHDLRAFLPADFDDFVGFSIATEAGMTAAYKAVAAIGDDIALEEDILDLDDLYTPVAVGRSASQRG